ncbi:MAG: LLM class flavin-dependent oxidoreductase [Deltaproteobacteria bacterium]|nr:LLM class flavin-dependent oxidoreductase [Deltaproteobacteria bacterium]
MILDIFNELQSALDSSRLDPRRLIADTLDQARLADELGYGCWWSVEHHTSPEFSMSSAPDLWLAVLSQHTRRIRLGTAGILSPFEINHPVRVAERAAWIDVLSGGRLELGLARSGGAEWETFEVDPETTTASLEEALRMLPRIWAPGEFEWKSELAKIPRREFAPKPLQQPHPPLWQTVSTPTSSERAGRLGVGLLAAAPLATLDYIRLQLEAYDRGLAACENPAGASINAQRAVFVLVHCAETRREVVESRAAEAALWFMNAAPFTFRVQRDNWFTIVRGHESQSAAGSPALEGPEPPPTPEELADPNPTIRLLHRQRAGLPIDPEEALATIEAIPTAVIGDIDTCRRKLQAIQALGVDRLLCLMQFGPLEPARILNSIRTLGESVLPGLRG